MAVAWHTWLWVSLPDGSWGLAFTYESPPRGLAAQGARVSHPITADMIRKAVEQPNFAVQSISTWNRELRPLQPEEVRAFNLPEKPTWLGSVEAQAVADLPWRRDPLLATRFHHNFPDDIEVLFHFPQYGQAERLWVRLDAVDSKWSGYTGMLLTAPHTPAGLQVGLRVTVRVPQGDVGPVFLSEEMKQNLNGWHSRCVRCGFDLVPHPIGEIVQRSFDGNPHIPSFTLPCAHCGGSMVVERNVFVSGRAHPTAR